MKKTAILIAALILIPALTLGSVLFLLHRSDIPDDEDLIPDNGECIHESYSWRLMEDNEGTRVLQYKCTSCGNVIQERRLYSYWQEGILLEYYKAENGTAVLSGIVWYPESAADELTMPDTLDGLPLETLDIGHVYVVKKTGAKLRITIGAYVKEIVTPCSFDSRFEWSVDPQNETFIITDGLLINVKEKTLVKAFSRPKTLGTDQTVAVPDDGSVERIGEGAFSQCPVDVIAIPDTVVYIDKKAFEGCEFKTFHIGKNIKEIGEGAFYGCGRLTGITVDPQNDRYAFTDGCLIDRASGTLIAATADCVIPSDGSVTRIGAQAFANGSYITRGHSINIPSSIRSVGEQAFLGAYFDTVYIEDVAAYCAADKGDYYSIPFGLETKIYVGGNPCEDLVIPAGVREIKPYSFYSAPIKTLNFEGDDAEIIGDRAFAYSTLISATLPAGIKTIGRYAFCASALEKLTFEPGCAAEIRCAAFGLCKLNDITLPDSAKVIGAYAFSGAHTGKLTLPDSLVAVGDRAFGRFDEIYIGASLARIDGSIFDEAVYDNKTKLEKTIKSVTVSADNLNYAVNGGCFIDLRDGKLIYALNDAVIPGDGSVKIICEKSFVNCSKLGKVVIPDSVAEIRTEAFYECDNIEQLVIPGTAQVECDAFDHCEIERLIFAEGVEKVEWQRVFCCAVGRLELPETLVEFDFTNIINNTIREDVYLPDSLELLTFSSYYAFYENLPAISISPDTKLGEGEARERYEIDGLSDMITKRGE
ncbi:MAG: leucine-rich repeat protein [Clostridia bacterium]|nr:leucine-rich repeat protein [Clostridia bacterium]